MKYTVDPIAQRTKHTCWEACGRMMWNWRYRNDPGMLPRYEDKVFGWTNVDKGLDKIGMRTFFGLLKLRTLDPAHGYNVRFALQWTPVIVAYRGTPSEPGHIVVVSAFDGRDYTVIDPQGAINMDPAAKDKYWDVSVFPQAKSSLDSGMERFIFYW